MKVNLSVLQWLVEQDTPIRERAGDHADAAIGVAKFVIGHDGNLHTLSPKQMQVFEISLRPMLDRVPCDGPVGFVGENEDQSSCIGDGFVDDVALLTSYEEDEFLCSSCRYQIEKMAADD